MASWSSRLGQKEHLCDKGKLMEVKQTYHSVNGSSSLVAKSKIPDYVRYEKEPDSDDDMMAGEARVRLIETA